MPPKTKKPTKTTTMKTSSKTIVKPRPTPKPKNPATESLKWLQLHLPEETIAHRVAALMTGKQADAEHRSNADAEARALSGAWLIFSNAEEHAPMIAAKVNEKVADQMQVIASEVETVGAASFMKLIPTNRDLHRHVAVLLPEYDFDFRYEQGDAPCGKGRAWGRVKHTEAT